MLAATHAVTLGFLAQAMMGALLQMLPVVAGSPVSRPHATAALVHVLTLPGTLTLLLGFLLQQAVFFHAALMLLGAGFAVFASAIGISLWRAPANNPGVRAMRLALITLLVTVLLGTYLALGHAGDVPLARFPLTDLHLAWGMLGWVGILIAGVAYQVVPMFQLTPGYPGRMTRWLGGSLFFLLAVFSLAAGLPAAAFLRPPSGIGLALGFLGFAAITLRLQARRRRRLPDVTLDFWRVSMISLILAALLWSTTQMIPQWQAVAGYPLLLGILFIVGFAVSAVNGMLYKILPFLAWFHLQSRLRGTAPNIRELLPENRARLQFRLHLSALVLLVLAILDPETFAYPAGILSTASSGLLWWNLFLAWRVYIKRTQALTG